MRNFRLAHEKADGRTRSSVYGSTSDLLRPWESVFSCDVQVFCSAQSYNVNNAGAGSFIGFLYLNFSCVNEGTSSWRSLSDIPPSSCSGCNCSFMGAPWPLLRTCWPRNYRCPNSSNYNSSGMEMEIYCKTCNLLPKTRYRRSPVNYFLQHLICL